MRYDATERSEIKNAEGMAEEICRLTGSKSPQIHEPERPGDVRHSVASAERIRATGWIPRHTLESGLAETVAWYRR